MCFSTAATRVSAFIILDLLTTISLVFLHSCFTSVRLYNTRSTYNNLTCVSPQLLHESSTHGTCVKGMTYGHLGPDAYVDLGCSGRFEICFVEGKSEKLNPHWFRMIDYYRTENGSSKFNGARQKMRST